MKLGPEITACCYIGGFSSRSLKSSSLFRHSETFKIGGVIIDTWVPGKLAGSPAHSADRAESHKRVFNKPTKSSVLRGRCILGNAFAPSLQARGWFFIQKYMTALVLFGLFLGV
ncbi:hypothetical protein V2G26_013824 [Clonostachys chloroleuca]